MRISMTRIAFGAFANQNKFQHIGKAKTSILTIVGLKLIFA